jgi:Fe-S cluster assembly protein SufD
VLSFPTTADEDWRFTNLGAATKTDFQFPSLGREALSTAAFEDSAFADLGMARLVFVDGRFSPDRSTLSDLGGYITTLCAVLDDDPDRLRAHLGQHAKWQDRAFDALNTAFMTDGAVIDVPDGVTLDEPIHLHIISTADEQPMRSHIRNVITVGRGARATVIETHVGVGSGVYLSNPVTELVVGEDAVVDHTVLRHESPEAYHVGTLSARVCARGELSTHSLTLRGALVRGDLRCVLAGDHARAQLDGLYLATGTAHVDNHTHLEHAAPNCTSRELYKGILDGQSRAVFHGRILVHQDAQDTDSKQSNSNLLLSDDARVNTKPQLEIYADQVKCTHGATIGQIDADAVFYLRSRGISEAAARGLLVYSFANEVVERVNAGRVDHTNELGDRLAKHILAWLPQGDMIREALAA